MEIKVKKLTGEIKKETGKMFFSFYGVICLSREEAIKTREESK